MDRFAMDLRHGLRQMARSPGFTATAALVLALGIGISTAIFGVVDHILLRPLDLPAAERVMHLCEDHPQEGCISVSPPNAADWAEQSESFEAIGLARANSMSLRRDGEVSGLSVGLATPGLFRVLSATPALGRLIRSDDMLPTGSGHVVVVSHGFWASRLGGDTTAIGRPITLDDESYTVIGVLPADFAVPTREWVPVWIPLPFPPRSEELRGWRGFRGFGLIAAGVSPSDAQSELNRIQAGLAERYPDTLRGWGARVTPMKDYMVGRSRPILSLFLGAVGLVLLIVTVNLAALLLARATRRQREFAVRSALGAERPALVRQLLVEAGLLALLGGIGAVLVAFWATDAFVALAPPGIPRIDEVAVDGRILLFGLAITGVSAVAFGLAPSARLRRAGMGAVLRASREGPGTRSDSRLRRALVVTELALALVLVLSSGLLLRSFRTLAGWDPGFEVERLLTFQLYPPGSRYDSPEALASFYQRARERFAAIPGVRVVGTTSAGPLFGGGDGFTPFLVEGRPPVPLQDAPRVLWYDAGPGYFPALGVPIVEGRNFRESDRLGSTPAALVNRTMARRYWPDGSPVGARLRIPEWETDVEIVGVVPDLRPLDPSEEVAPAIYVSNRQRPRGASFFVLRSEGPPGDMVGAVRSALTELDPDMEPAQMSTLEDRLAYQLRTPRFNMLLVGLLAFVALVLGAAGIYGVVAYAVALRTREFGIRIALGAAAHEVVRAVLIEGLRLVAIGLVAGLVGAALFARLLRGVLVGVSATDTLAVVGTVLILAATGLLATLVPALRAARADPIEVIRAE